jgi:UDP-glucose 4-epimerase
VPYTFIAADLVEDSPEMLAQKLPKRLDACVHAAAAVNGSAPGYARDSLLVNGLGTRNMLEALCLRAAMDGAAHPGVEEASAGTAKPLPPLFLYCSTFHVYGPVDGHITEQAVPAPVNDYALTHLFGEEYCRMYAGNRNIPCVILRLSNGYGAPLHASFKQWNLLLPDLCRSAYETGRIVLRADPDQERDFVWLGAVAHVAGRLIAENPVGGATVPVFNVSSGAAVSLGEVARLAAHTAAGFLQKEVTLEFAAPGHEGTERFSPLSLDLQKTSEHNTGQDVSATGFDTPGERHLFVDNSAIRKALPGLAFSSRMKEEMTATLEFLRLHERP